MAKRKGRGRPKGSRVQKKVKGSEDAELVIPNTPLNVVKVEPDFIEEHEGGTSMPTKKGRGRPKGSQAKKFQESGHSILNSCMNPSKIVEVGLDSEEPQDPVVPNKNGQERPSGLGKYCQENACENFYCNQSNVMEVSLRCKEEQEAAATDEVDEPRERGLWQPIESINQENHQQNADTIVKPKRKGRGQTRGLSLQMKRQQSADGKLDVLIHPTKLAAIGPGRNDFITDLSLIVRQNARLNVRQWKKVPQSTRDTIVQNILNNWRLPHTDMVRKAILHEAGRLYQNWRSRLHEYYLKFETKDEALKHVPSDVNDSDWQFLVDYFSSPYFEIMSAKNKANKAKQLIKHTTGSKSFLATSYDARDPVTGTEPDMQTFWQLTHKRGNGEWIDEASKEINDKAAQQINEKRCQIEYSQEGGETNEEEIISTAFQTLVGKKSYMRGFGPFGAELRSSSSSRFDKIQQLQAELDAQKRETENARKDCDEIRAKLVEVESHLEDERLKRIELEARLLDRQNEIQEISCQVQNTIQAALSQYLPPKSEAESSTKNKRKIAELEAQLHEAEDVITDIRSELIKYRKDQES